MSETERILQIPKPDPLESIPDMTRYFLAPGGKGSLRPLQSAALYHILKYGSLYGPIGTGVGKTLLCCLIPTALGAKRPLLLLPPANIPQFWSMLQMYAQQGWSVCRRIETLSYAKLSGFKNSDILEEQLRPDLIIADEAHSLGDQRSSRTLRVARYLKAHPEVRFIPLSASMERKSVRDAAHLQRYSLRNHCIVPIQESMLEAWGKVIDAGADPSDLDLAAVAGFVRGMLGAGVSVSSDSARDAYRKRLHATPGIVVSTNPSVDSSLIMFQRSLAVPEQVQAILTKVSTTWTSPTGEEEFDSPLQLHRYLSLISAGFYYRWKWGPDGPNKPWIEARRDYNREVRNIVVCGEKNLDSPKLVALAIARRDPRIPPAMYHAFVKWHAFKDTPEPPRETVWVDPFFVYDVARWIESRKAKNQPAIVWYKFRALAAAVHTVTQIKVFGEGSKPPEGESSVGKGVLGLFSMSVHGTGKNFQYAYSDQLLTYNPPSNTTVEQLLSRTHRAGQPADEVHCTYYAHTEAFAKGMADARQKAEWYKSTQGTEQRLTMATWAVEAAKHHKESA